MSKLSSPRGPPRAPPPPSELGKENILDVKAAVTSATSCASAAAAKQLDNYIIVDVGANLTNKKFSRDLDSVIQRAKDSGVTKIMVTGTSVQSSRDALRLSRLYPGALYATAGIHPHDAKSWDAELDDFGGGGESTLTTLTEMVKSPECVAVGECGLDFNRNFSPPEVQLEVFEKQIQLACRVGKPLFLHERDAHQEMVALLEKYKPQLPNCVIHCFTGTKEQAANYLSMGFYIGLTGYLWKDKSEDGVRKILQDQVIPPDRLLVETDAPFMYPNTRASKLPQHVKDALTEKSQTFLQRYCTFQRNEPCSLPVTVEMISAYLNKTPEDLLWQLRSMRSKCLGCPLS